VVDIRREIEVGGSDVGGTDVRGIEVGRVADRLADVGRMDVIVGRIVCEYVNRRARPISVIDLGIPNKRRIISCGVRGVGV
jgi:hypothetical protein